MNYDLKPNPGQSDLVCWVNTSSCLHKSAASCTSQLMGCLLIIDSYSFAKGYKNKETDKVITGT